jgi:hypothetical protein
MNPRFIRLRNVMEQREELINVAMIWKIEVEYGTVRNGQANKVGLEAGLKNPNAVRFYRIFVSGQAFFIASDPNSAGMKLIEEIYHNSIVA